MSFEYPYYLKLLKDAEDVVANVNEQIYHDEHRPRATKYQTTKFYNFPIKHKHKHTLKR